MRNLFLVLDLKEEALPLGTFTVWPATAAEQPQGESTVKEQYKNCNKKMNKLAIVLLLNVPSPFYKHFQVKYKFFQAAFKYHTRYSYIYLSSSPKDKKKNLSCFSWHIIRLSSFHSVIWLFSFDGGLQNKFLEHLVLE